MAGTSPAMTLIGLWVTAAAMAVTVLTVSRICGAARSVAPQIRDRSTFGVCNGPGSAAHHYVLRCARDTKPYFLSSPSSFHRFCTASMSAWSGQALGGKRAPPKSGSGS